MICVRLCFFEGTFFAKFQLCCRKDKDAPRVCASKSVFHSFTPLLPPEFFHIVNITLIIPTRAVLFAQNLRTQPCFAKLDAILCTVSQSITCHKVKLESFIPVIQNKF